MAAAAGQIAAVVAFAGEPGARMRAVAAAGSAAAPGMPVAEPERPAVAAARTAGPIAEAETESSAGGLALGREPEKLGVPGTVTASEPRIAGRLEPGIEAEPEAEAGTAEG